MARLSSATTAPARRGQGHLAPGYDLGHVAFAGSLDRIELSEPAFVGGASGVRFEHSSAGLSLHVALHRLSGQSLRDRCISRGP